MSPDAASSDFAAKVLDSQDSELRRLVAAGLAPLPLPELLALQVALLAEGDEEIAKAANESLSSLAPKIVASVIREGSEEQVLRYFATHSKHPVVVEAILRLRAVPRDLLVAMATTLEADAQELLLLRQDAIVEEPAILDALAANEGLSMYAERRIAEYREHLLPRDEAEDDEDLDILDVDVEGEADDEEVAKIRAEFEAIEGDADDSELENLFRASEVRIRTMAVAVRMRLARGATPLLRRILIRDQNPNVALAVMKFSPITELEVERIALSRVVVDDVLTHIARSKNWIRRYPVMHSLCQNPRTPVNVAMSLLPRLSARHLQQLSRNRNVSDSVRSRSLRLYRIKTQ